ncbi:hypothetical protein EUGRSUZ_E02200 [Eucalyptus grandis]|uniref:Uncharacterized protein n=2 Tax=Eucalyptus grandis TaxID=71139 RepID=A0ACC3KXK9_EUCGR|nr:hypothetical protein EUGRSUZ_E02200 [Eucalyptus grandis]
MIVGRVRTGRLDDALKLFYEMPVRDAICWNTMIKGCLDCGDLTMAEELFNEMPKPSVVLWATLIDGSSDLDRKIFQQMPIRDLAAWNAMLHGYCENARVDDAVKLFEQMSSRNVISWTSMIGRLDQNSKSEEALFVFEKMFKSGVVSNPEYFDMCIECLCKCIVFYSWCVDSRSRLCASLITFYANCKQIEKATQVSYEAVYRNVVICTALLTGYGLNGRHEDGLRVFSDMMRTSVLPNQSSFGQKHLFLSGDKSHPLSEDIYWRLDWLNMKLKELGYVPDKGFSLHDVEDEQKEESLFYHSERLAVAFALITTVEGNTITLMKNLRICGDCHSVVKLMQRLLIMRLL